MGCYIGDEVKPKTIINKLLTHKENICKCI